MASPSVPASEAGPKAYANSIAELVGDWIRQGTEGFIATQKILLDLAAQQNALALTIVRERLGLFSLKPSKAAIDLAGKGVHNFFEAQELLLDVVARQNKILADGLKPGVSGTPIEALAEVVHRGLDSFIAAQKHYIQVFEAETEGAVHDFGDGKKFDPKRISEIAREGLKDLLQSQKRFLEIVEEELTEKKAAAEPAEGEQKRIDLFEIAKQSVDSFVETQKKMLDLASEQINVNVNLARQVLSFEVQRKPVTALPELVKKSVDSFVAAQKALVELASKPRKPAEGAEMSTVAQAS
jgi:hypothetical protein